eukprot:SAG31_NODE_5347_length_2594_cov_2.007615_3_plen_188_part_00
MASPLKRRNGELLVVDQLKITVQPRINPILSEYITELTGITNEQIRRDGVTLDECLRQFKQFCGGGRSKFVQVGSFGSDEEVLHENMGLPGASVDLEKHRTWTASFHDIVPFFVQQGLDRSAFSSGSLYKAYGIEANANVHDSLWDCTSMYLCLKLIDDMNACGWHTHLVDGGRAGHTMLQCDLAKL